MFEVCLADWYLVPRAAELTLLSTYSLFVCAEQRRGETVFQRMSSVGQCIWEERVSTKGMLQLKKYTKPITHLAGRSWILYAGALGWSSLVLWKGVVRSTCLFACLVWQRDTNTTPIDSTISQWMPSYNYLLLFQLHLFLFHFVVLERIDSSRFYLKGVGT